MKRFSSRDFVQLNEAFKQVQRLPEIDWLACQTAQAQSCYLNEGQASVNSGDRAVVELRAPCNRGPVNTAYGSPPM